MIWPYQCKYCGEIYDRADGVGVHTDCENKLTRQKLRSDPVYMTRYKFDKDHARLMAIVIKRDGAICASCGSQDNLTIDHIKPISVGGTNDLKNLQVLCNKCNSSKGNKYDR